MTITLSSKEFDEAVSLWLKEQGFSANSYYISTRVLVGRGDNPLGTRLEIQLDPKASVYSGNVDHSMANIPLRHLDEITEKSTIRKFGQGHADE